MFFMMSLVEFFMYLIQKPLLKIVLAIIFVAYQVTLVCMLPERIAIVYGIILFISAIALFFFLMAMNHWFDDESVPIELPNWNDIQPLNSLAGDEEPIESMFLEGMEYHTKFGQILFKSAHYYFKAKWVLVVTAIISINLWFIPLALISVFFPITTHAGGLVDDME